MIVSVKVRTNRSGTILQCAPAAFASLLALLLMLGACAGVPVSYHDATTYTHLVDLKVDSTLLVESFDTLKVEENGEEIAAVSRYLKRA